MRSIQFAAVAGAAALMLHCSEQALNGDTTPANAGDCTCNSSAPVFEKLYEGAMSVANQDTIFNTESIDVSAYREVVLRVDSNPFYGDSNQPSLDIVLPTFADSIDGTFLSSGLPILSEGGRVTVNGPFLRLRYASINDEGFSKAYAVYGVK